jgi:hypothetical protein
MLMLFRPLPYVVTLLAAALLGASASSALELRQSPKAVLELFTSQGCSSCPKADALLEKMGEQDDLITLAYHVDYWDYIGWQDTFGDKANTKRQRDYAAAWGSSRIFTPQLVVNGACGVVGSKQDEVDAAIDAATMPLTVSLKPDTADVLDVTVPGAEIKGVNSAVVWLVTYIDRAEVEIGRGENKGRKIAYTQVVTGKQPLGSWQPATGANVRLSLDKVLTGGANGGAILVQEDRNGLPGPILGAASFTR